MLAGVHTIKQCLELAILDDLPVVPRHLKERKEEREWRVSGESEGMVIGEIGERCTAACTSSSNLLFVKFERILFIELANAPLSNADRTESFCPNSMFDGVIADLAYQDFIPLFVFRYRSLLTSTASG